MIYKIDKEILLRIKRSSIIGTVLMLAMFIGTLLYFYISNNSAITASAIITSLISLLAIVVMLFFILRFQYKKYKTYEIELDPGNNFFIIRDNSGEKKVFFENIKKVRYFKAKSKISSLIINEDQIYNILKVERMDELYDVLSSKIDTDLVLNNKVARVLLIVSLYILITLVATFIIIKPITSFFVSILLGIYIILVKPLSRIFAGLNRKIEFIIGAGLITLSVILLIIELVI